MQFSFAAFQEPRGVMRVLQFIFAICAFSSTCNFELNVSVACENANNSMSAVIDYPFSFVEKICTKDAAGQTPVHISADLSSDSQFFVATGVLSLLYCVFIVAVYGLFDNLYKEKQEFPMADFMLTCILAILWLSSSAAWSNGTNALKSMTDVDLVKDCGNAFEKCVFSRTSFSSLNISLLLGFLNFFLWASDLWFLYKETIWFQSRNVAQPEI